MHAQQERLYPYESNNTNANGLLSDFVQDPAFSSWAKNSAFGILERQHRRSKEPHHRDSIQHKQTVYSS
eukprot:92247-Ditylum_brightwellii.AAC.1